MIFEHKTKNHKKIAVIPDSLLDETLLLVYSMFPKEERNLCIIYKSKIPVSLSCRGS